MPIDDFAVLLLEWGPGTVENHGKKMAKNTAYFCENRKNHGKITAVYMAANLLNVNSSMRSAISC